MWFGIKTKNIRHDIRKKNPISWLNIDTNQLFIYIIAWAVIFLIVFVANIWLLWKIFITFLVVVLTINLAKKYDDSSINNVNDDYWRTNLEWFRIFIKKNVTWNKSVDKWNNYDYFKK